MNLTRIVACFDPTYNNPAAYWLFITAGFEFVMAKKEKEKKAKDNTD